MHQYTNLAAALLLQCLSGAIQDFIAFLRVGGVDVEKLSSTAKCFNSMHDPLHVRQCRPAIEMYAKDIPSALCQGQASGLTKSARSPKNQGPICHRSSRLVVVLLPWLKQILSLLHTDSPPP